MSRVKYQGRAYYTEHNHRLVFLDGRACLTLADCYHTLQEQLSIPDYFGHNLDALEEVLDDLDWIIEDEISIIIFYPEDLLAKETGKKETFLQILQSAGDSRLTVVYIEH